MGMNLDDIQQHLLALEQQASELAAEQTELQRRVRHGKLGPTDYKAVQAELAGVRAELAAVRASVAAANRQRKHLLAEQALLRDRGRVTG